MARGLNKAQIIGFLGADPETKYMPSGTAVVNLSVATNEQWTDKQTGEKNERTEWHRVALFGRVAEVAGQYLQKGSQVYLEGKLRTRKWKDKEGNDRWTTEIIAHDMQMLGSSNGQQQGQRAPSAPPQQPQQREPEQADPFGGDDPFNDEIPF